MPPSTPPTAPAGAGDQHLFDRIDLHLIRVLHTVLTDETRNLINAERLAAMKKTALLRVWQR